MAKVDVTISLHMTVEADHEEDVYDVADDAASSLYDMASKFFHGHEHKFGASIEVHSVDMEES